MRKDLLSLTAAFFVIALTGAVSASPVVNGFDLATFNFDITSYSWTTSEFVDATASGTTNGIAWSISPTSLWSGRTTTNGTFSFGSLPDPTDNLHPAGNYTITFGQTVQTLIVALSNNDTADSINFGLTPSFTYGNVTFSGTQAVLTQLSGGLAWFTNVDSLTITNVDNNGITDGYDLAFDAIAAPQTQSSGVPEPVTLSLFGAGLAGAAAMRRRKAKS